MRIISGTCKGRRITPPGKIKARPTTDFAKESLFNILQNEIDIEQSKVLDLFSGTGAISYEFLSRGAPQVVSVELDRKIVKFIESFSEKCGFQNHKIVSADAYAFLRTYKFSFDIVYADPPYGHSHVLTLPEKIMKSEVMKPDGLMIIEHGPETDFSNSPYLTSHRKYGNVNFSFFRP